MPKILIILLFLCFSLNAKQRALKYKTTTPIKYLVVIFPENRSFDHLFSTYPIALNPPGEPKFKAKKNTPTINGLNHPLLTINQNGVQPFRLNRKEIALCSPAHHYAQLQEDAHAGLLDHFIQTNPKCKPAPMGYYDGNTVTALWNYAQRFAMSDNFYSTIMGPSTPGAINLISGQTHGSIPPDLTIKGEIVVVDGTIIGDPDPTFDDCSVGPTVALSGKNIGDLLNAKGITWGWFQGGFADCSQSHLNSKGINVLDYIAHHEPFQYYPSTANPLHLPPSSKKMIGYTDQANHQYDIDNFWMAAKNNNLPAVSFVKPAAYQDGHADHSDVLALQEFLVETINALQKLPEWKKMAIIIAFDDTGGFYDHVMPPIINDSQTEEDSLAAPGVAGTNPPLGGYQGRLAYGNRVPALFISPFSKKNSIDHTVTDQTSILKFIEDNWILGRIGDFSFDAYAGSIVNAFDFNHPNYNPLILNAKTGKIKHN